MRRRCFEISGLTVRFHGDRGRVTHAVDSVDLSLDHGASLGIVGESGCGKSVTALTIMRLLTSNAEIGGSIVFNGRNLLRIPDHEMRDLRGDRLTMIFQEPMTSLNPSLTIGEQIAETLIRHRDLSPQARKGQGHRADSRVRIPSRRAALRRIPAQLSGGMRQRVMIAIALACDPQLLIADEPTTALDVTIQAQILDLMRELKSQSGAAIILISHDLGVIGEICDEVAVMYAGEIVERAPAARCLSGRSIPIRSACSGRRRGLISRPTSLPRSRAWCRKWRSAGRVPLRAALPLCRRTLPQPSVRPSSGSTTAIGRGVFMRRWKRTSHETVAPGGKSQAPFHGRANACSGVQFQSVKAVDGVSFSLDAGDTFALVGESGCGKSTLGRLVLRLIEPQEGRIVFDGRDITGSRITSCAGFAVMRN